MGYLTDSGVSAQRKIYIYLKFLEGYDNNRRDIVQGGLDVPLYFLHIE